MPKSIVDDDPEVQRYANGPLQFSLEDVCQSTRTSRSDGPNSPANANGSTPDESTTNPHTDLTYVRYEPAFETLYLPLIRSLISKDLSEPYSIYVYRYFLYQWGHLCYLAFDSTSYAAHHPWRESNASRESNGLKNTPKGVSMPVALELIGVIINKLEPHKRHSDAYGDHQNNYGRIIQRTEASEGREEVTYRDPLRGYIAMLAVRDSHRGRGIASHLVRLGIAAMRKESADEIVLETEIENEPSLKLYERLGFERSKRLHRYYLNGNGAFRLGLRTTAPKPRHSSNGPSADGNDIQKVSEGDSGMKYLLECTARSRGTSHTTDRQKSRDFVSLLR